MYNCPIKYVNFTKFPELARDLVCNMNKLAQSWTIFKRAYTVGQYHVVLNTGPIKNCDNYLRLHMHIHCRIIMKFLENGDFTAFLQYCTTDLQSPLNCYQ